MFNESQHYIVPHARCQQRRLPATALSGTSALLFEHRDILCHTHVTRAVYHFGVASTRAAHCGLFQFIVSRDPYLIHKLRVLQTSMPALQRPTAELLVINVPTITSDETNADVLKTFGRHRDLVSLPVLENDIPIGLISRNIFMSQMSKPYYRELYEKKSCIAFMDKSPLIVDVHTPIETLAARAVESGDKTLADGFLIVDQGCFVGIGVGLDLMQVLVDLQTEKNRQVMQSLDYASTIQRAMLSESLTTLRHTLGDADIVWAPRDVIGGDFYHFQRHDEGWFAAIADCTGHGVPGAFLTLIASSSLEHALSQYGPHDPALLMAAVSRSMKRALGQHSATDHANSNDGMDATFLWFDRERLTLTSAHANMPIFVLRPDSAQALNVSGERTGLGYADTPANMLWTNHRTQLTSGTIVSCCTDGLIDQIGGPKNIAYGKRRLRNALVRHREHSMPQLTQLLMDEFLDYQGSQTRRDDLTLLNFRIE